MVCLPPSELNLNLMPLEAGDVVHGEEQKGSSSNGPDKQWSTTITFLELVAMMLSGAQWQGQPVHVWCNNKAAVQAILARSCKDLGFMHLLQFLCFMEATFLFQMSASHIPGVNNTLARSSLPK